MKGVCSGPAAMLSVCLLMPLVAHSEKRSIDGEHSRVVVRVFKAGVFSVFAHDHEIAAPITRGSVESGEPRAVELEIDARKLRVLDQKAPEEERLKIQKTMNGPEVLDSTRFSEIRFASSAVEKTAGWTVRGNLTLHGQTHPIVVHVTQKGDRYLGSVSLNQSDFGITPVKIAGGTVRVKDEVKIEFEIALMH
jgi:polyisoprenoid-binding protein YceI